MLVQLPRPPTFPRPPVTLVAKTNTAHLLRLVEEEEEEERAPLGPRRHFPGRARPPPSSDSISSDCLPLHGVQALVSASGHGRHRRLQNAAPAAAAVTKASHAATAGKAAKVLQVVVVVVAVVAVLSGHRLRVGVSIGRLRHQERQGQGLDLLLLETAGERAVVANETGPGVGSKYSPPGFVGVGVGVWCVRGGAKYRMERQASHSEDVKCLLYRPLRARVSCGWCGNGTCRRVFLIGRSGFRVSEAMGAANADLTTAAVARETVRQVLASRRLRGRRVQETANTQD